MTNTKKELGITKGEWEKSKKGLISNDGEIAVMCADKRIALVAQHTDCKKKDLWMSKCDEREANAQLIADAGTVANKTGKLPSQLADENKILLAALSQLVGFLSPKLDGSFYVKQAKSAIAKAEGRAE